MKKDRNCGCGGNQAPYPVYPTYPGMMPMNQGMPMMNQGVMPIMNQGMPNNIMMPTVPNTNTMTSMNSDYTTLSNQVNNLERRVSRLESMINSSSNITPKYNDSNYYMV